MTKEKLSQANQVVAQLEHLRNAEIKMSEGSFVRPDVYCNVLAEFIDVEDYNNRIRLRRKQLEETLASL